jgi:hypothetical protein
MDNRERMIEMKDHFKQEQNVIDLMKSNEWSLYLYDYFELDPDSYNEEFWYDEMGRQCRKGWLRISKKRRQQIIDQTDLPWESFEIMSNASEFERRAW